MPRSGVLGAVLVVLVPQSSGAQGAPAGQPLVIEHVTVIDVERGSPLPDRTVFVQASRIAGVTRAADAQVPPGARVVDGRGKFLIPGLWDMHVHAAKQETSGAAAPDRWYGTLFVANGVTGVREMWGDMALIRAWRERVAAGDSATPRIVASGHLLDGAPPVWRGSVVATTAEAARHAVDSLQAAGAQFIKVYSRLPREAYMAAAEEAKARGLPFAGHVPFAVTAAEASDAGQRSIEHLSRVLSGCSPLDEEITAENRRLLMLVGGQDSVVGLNRRRRPELHASPESARCRALAARFQRNGTWQTPTLTVLYNNSEMGDPALAQDPREAYLPPAIVAPWNARRAARLKVVSPGQLANAKAIYALDVAVVGRLFRSGVPILAGTDVGNPHCLPGFGLHDELVRLVEAGLPPAEALKAATLNPARYFEATDSLGTVAPRKLADLVLLDADPLADIHNTTRIRAVILNGIYLDRVALDAMLEGRKRAAAALTAR